MSNKLLLTIGIVLLALGLLKPNLQNLQFPINRSPSVVAVENYQNEAPLDPELLESAKAIIDIIKNSDSPSKKLECLKLSSLYYDLATLISLEGDDEVVSNTTAIREANILSGKMLKLNIKDKYSNLPEKCEELLAEEIGTDDIALDSNLRKKAAEAFRALSWAFYKGLY